MLGRGPKIHSLSSLPEILVGVEPKSLPLLLGLRLSQMFVTLNLILLEVPLLSGEHVHHLVLEHSYLAVVDYASGDLEHLPLEVDFLLVLDVLLDLDRVEVR